MPTARLFPALLRHWRSKRGLSQLDLGLAADVSARHISFLETGRSQPSAPMILRLGATLDVPLRHINEMLRAAGHPPAYPEAELEDGLPDMVCSAIALMKSHHEPFPLVVIDRTYDLLDLNRGALAMFQAAVPTLDVAGQRPNLAKLTFAEDGARPAIANFDEVGAALLWRIQREVLATPEDGPLRALLDELLAMPAVGERWREADLSVPAAPTVNLHVRAGPYELRFMTMVTALQAPQTVALEELRIETWFPTDEATADACRALAEAATSPAR